MNSSHRLIAPGYNVTESYVTMTSHSVIFEIVELSVTLNQNV